MVGRRISRSAHESSYAPDASPDEATLDRQSASTVPEESQPDTDAESSYPPVGLESESGAAEDFDDNIVLEVPSGDVSLPLPEEPNDIRLPRLHQKALTLPESPGVYFLKDSRGVVIYVGKSLSLKQRVSSYFQPSTDLGPVKQRLLDYVVDFDTLLCDSEVEALLIENRLIKDTKPRFNARLTDGKSYPYLEITSGDDFPGVYVTRQPRTSGSKLYGPFTSGYALKQAVIYMQRAFKFRTCHLDILESDTRRKFFRPCILYNIHQCSAPCADKISREDYAADLDRLKHFLESNRGDALRVMTADMQAAAAARDFERAAMLRDQIKALRALSHRGKSAKVMQPELFFQNHADGLKDLQDLLELPDPIRSIEAIDIAHFQGEATVGSLVTFIDGKPFKDGYRRYRIKTVSGIDDFRCIQEVVSRRYRLAGAGEELYPDVVLIDGGQGQLSAALEAFSRMTSKPSMVISLAKREEEIFVQNRSVPFKLARTNSALKLLQHARDEAHRFAQGYHHLLIARRQFQDLLHAKNKRKKKSPRVQDVSAVGGMPSGADTAASASISNSAEFKVLTEAELKAKLGGRGGEKKKPRRRGGGK